MLPKSQVAVLIPARCKSARLPEKVILPLCGKPLLQWVYERACNGFGKENVFILIDEPKIAHALESAELKNACVMTPESCSSGTERLRWALRHPLKELQAKWIVGWQADEPLLPLEAVFQVLEALKKNQKAVLSTLCTPLDPKDFEDPNVVKCVTDFQGKALYFSRSPIPNPGWHKERIQMPTIAKRHVGVYIWSSSFLRKEFSAQSSSSLQEAEDLEQLGLLEAGETIQTAFWPEQIGAGIDVFPDLERVSEWLRKEAVDLLSLKNKRSPDDLL